MAATEAIGQRCQSVMGWRRVFVVGAERGDFRFVISPNALPASLRAYHDVDEKKIVRDKRSRLWYNIRKNFKIVA